MMMPTIKQQCEELRSLMIQCRNHLNSRNFVTILNSRNFNRETEEKDNNDKNEESD